MHYLCWRTKLCSHLPQIRFDSQSKGAKKSNRNGSRKSDHSSNSHHNSRGRKEFWSFSCPRRGNPCFCWAFYIQKWMCLLGLLHTKMNVFVGPFTYKNEEISDNKTCSCPLVRYFHTLFWDDIAIICWWKLSEQTSHLSETFFLS